ADHERALRSIRCADAGRRAAGGGEIPCREGPHDCHADRPRGCEVKSGMCVLDSSGPRLWSQVGRGARAPARPPPSPAAGPLAGLPVGGRGRPPRSRGTAPLRLVAWFLLVASSATAQIRTVAL